MAPSKKPSVEALAAQDTANFERWKKSPPGLSATGFGKIGPVMGQTEALQELQRIKRARK